MLFNGLRSLLKRSTNLTNISLHKRNCLRVRKQPKNKARGTEFLELSFKEETARTQLTEVNREIAYFRVKQEQEDRNF